MEKFLHVLDERSVRASEHQAMINASFCMLNGHSHVTNPYPFECRTIVGFVEAAMYALFYVELN